MTNTRGLLGAELRRVRQIAGHSGREMATTVGVSQAKVSRVENGQAVLTLPEVTAWCAAAAADEATTARLVHLVEATFTESLPWRGALTAGRAHLQGDAHDMEASARTIRNCQSGLVPGLLQTAAYARALFPIVTAGMPDHDHEAAVSGRMRRQEILYDPSRRFDFLVTEPALRWRPGPAALMAAQITKILNVATLDNVTIGVLPFGPQTGPWDSFVVYDDRDDDQDPIVIMELPHAMLTLSDPGDVQVYRDTFARWRQAALSGDEAVEWLRRLAGEFGEQRSQSP
jgi:transcriptional regulator with XRE-family HTH domain